MPAFAVSIHRVLTRGVVLMGHLGDRARLTGVVGVKSACVTIVPVFKSLHLVAESLLIVEGWLHRWPLELLLHVLLLRGALIVLVAACVEIHLALLLILVSIVGIVCVVCHIIHHLLDLGLELLELALNLRH